MACKKSFEGDSSSGGMYTLSETFPREVWHVPPLPCVSSFPRSQNANFQNPRCENTPLIGRESPPPSVSLSLLLLSASATLGNTHLPLLYTLKGAGCVAKHRIWPINGSTLNRRAVSHLPWRTKLNSATFDIAHKNNKTKSVNTGNPMGPVLPPLKCMSVLVGDFSRMIHLHAVFLLSVALVPQVYKEVC